MKRRSIQLKIQGLVIGSVILTVTVLLAPIFWQKAAMEREVKDQLLETVRVQVSQTASNVLRICQGYGERTSRRLDHDLEVVRNELSRAGEIRFEGSVSWKAVNQFNKEVLQVSLPKMSLHGVWLGQNRDPAVESPVVDQVTHFTRDVCTIFQRMNDEGDMLRVATTVLAADGRRAVGTFIPHKNPDGKVNDVVAAVLKGNAYQGTAIVADRRHSCLYEPLWDSPQKSKIVGMLFAGIDVEDINRELRATIQQTIVGKTGYVCVLGAKGDARGVYRISKDGKRDGESIWQSRDANGNLVVQETVRQALSAQKDEVCFVRYPWKNEGDLKPRMKVTSFAYYEPWDWVICAGTYEDDYEDTCTTLRASLDATVWYAAVCAVGSLIVLSILAVLVTQRPYAAD